MPEFQVDSFRFLMDWSVPKFYINGLSVSGTSGMSCTIDYDENDVNLHAYIITIETGETVVSADVIDLTMKFITTVVDSSDNIISDYYISLLQT